MSLAELLQGLAYYEGAWAEYEAIHGEEHPYRYFERVAAAGA